MQKVFLIGVLFLVGACSSKKSIDPLEHLTRAEQQQILWPVTHYAAKLPPGATQDTKFSQQFDQYYTNVALDYNFVFASPAENDSYFFLLSRPARSITPMFEGIGGKLKYENDSLIEYEEVFRTWKMTDKDLKERGRDLFLRMVKGADLSIYYSKYAGDKYIEFPDDRFHYDKAQRKWIDSAMDSISFE